MLSQTALFEARADMPLHERPAADQIESGSFEHASICKEPEQDAWSSTSFVCAITTSDKVRTPSHKRTMVGFGGGGAVNT